MFFGSFEVFLSRKSKVKCSAHIAASCPTCSIFVVEVCLAIEHGGLHAGQITPTWRYCLGQVAVFSNAIPRVHTLAILRLLRLPSLLDLNVVLAPLLCLTRSLALKLSDGLTAGVSASIFVRQLLSLLREERLLEGLPVKLSCLHHLTLLSRVIPAIVLHDWSNLLWDGRTERIYSILVRVTVGKVLELLISAIVLSLHLHGDRLLLLHDRLLILHLHLHLYGRLSDRRRHEGSHWLSTGGNGLFLNSSRFRLGYHGL